MASISRILQLFRITTPAITFSRNLNSTVRRPPSSLVPQTTVVPLLLSNNSWIYQQNEKIKLPVINKIEIDLPNGLKWIPPLEEPNDRKELEMPASISNKTPLETARLIVIRRKKMKKHKLKKLRIRMKYEWAKKRQRRELKKEKEFQAVLIQQCKDAEAFSAERYVEERLQKMNQVPSPHVNHRRQPPS